MDFKTIVTRLAAETTLSAKTIVAVATVLGDPQVIVLATAADVLAFARTLPVVEQEIREGKKISAIKALRQASEQAHITGGTLKASQDSNVLGLKAAKDAVDALAAEINPPQPPATLPFTACPYCWGNLNETTTWDRCPTNRHNHRGV